MLNPNDLRYLIHLGNGKFRTSDQMPDDVLLDLVNGEWRHGDGLFTINSGVRTRPHFQTDNYLATGTVFVYQVDHPEGRRQAIAIQNRADVTGYLAFA